MKNRIDIGIQDKRVGGASPFVKRVAEQTLSQLKKNNVALDITLCSQEFMRDLNRRFRKKNKSTNVLSFPEPASFVAPPDKKYLGEIYISPAYVSSHNQDLAHIVIHGILHLCGFHHPTKPDRMRMERKEDELLTHL